MNDQCSLRILKRFGLGCALLFAAEATLQSASLEEYSEKRYPVGPKASLSVRNTDGTIYIYGSNEPEIKIVTRKRAYSKARLDGIATKVTSDGENISIETVFPPAPKAWSAADRSGTVDYLILVPQTCSISRAKLATGEIIVEGLSGPEVNAQLGNGKLTAQNCFSSTKLSVSAGTLDVSFAWWEGSAFSLSAEIANGDLRVALPPNPSVQIDATTEKGQVRNAFAEKSGGVGRGLQMVIGDGASAALQLRAAQGNIRIEKSF